MGIPETLWNNLKWLVKDFSKKVQLSVDYLSGNPDGDNSSWYYEPPYEFDGNMVFSTRVRDIIDGYTDSAHGQGYQQFVYRVRVNLSFNHLRLLNLQYLGQGNDTTPFLWSKLSESDLATINAAREAMYTEGSVFVDNQYEDIYDLQVSFRNAQPIKFKPVLHDNTDLKLTFPSVNGDVVNNGFTIGLSSSALDTNEDGYIIPKNQSGINTTQHNMYTGDPLIAIMQDDIDCQQLANNLLSTHHEINNATSQGSYKIYYGDNYIIYYMPVGTKVNYNDLRTSTNRVIGDINSWFPDKPPIVFPTYEENKHEDDPPEIKDDDYVDMGLGVETDGMAMYNMAVITRDELIQLITDFEANADTGLSFIPHVLGLYKLGIESSQLLTTKSEQIKLHKEPNGTSAFTSVENYNIVDKQLTIIDCGSIKVDREELLTNTFYDYSPYSTYEMFIPGCGWITLPDTVVGRTISVSIVFDLTTCSCKGIVRSEGQLLGGSGTTLATVNGIIGSSVPLSINETGLQRAAIFNGSTQAAMALGTAFLGVGIGNPYMGASGVAMAAGALADNHVAGNTTYTNTKGGATDYSVFGDGYKAVLKITRPVVEIPDNYGHTVGFVVNEYGILSDFHGFTVCVNPHVHISATSDEKEEIKRLLESGVILPDGE